ncbi:MAG: hypothetical protein IKD76_00550 [Clostridia bacterium]|nr:hypothetical protein [Clostridia bacterium]
MKKEGSLKLIFAILVIILICLVSLGGIYVKDKNISKNVLADYILGTDLDSKTIVKLDVQKEEEKAEEVSSESDAEQSENTETSEENNNVADNNATENKEGQAENKENLYTLNNYKKSKKIIEERLRLSGVEQYLVRLDEKTGNIVVEVPEDVAVYILQSLNATGKTEIKISETGEVIASKNDIKSYNVGVDDSYVSSGIGKIVTMDIEFSKEATNRFKELKNNYVAPTNEEGTTEENNINILIDDKSLYSQEESKFLETASTGSLRLVFGQYTKDEEQIKLATQYQNARKMLVETEDLALKYNVAYDQIIHSNINNFGIKCVFAVILGAMFVYLLIKYKSKGILAELTIIGFGALLLLVFRYAKIQVTIASLVALAGIIILQFIYVIKLLSNKQMNSKKFTEKTIEFSKMLVPALIISIVLALVPALKTSILAPFGNISEMSFLGMVVFWGLILFELFNNILTRAILTNAKNK